MRGLIGILGGEILTPLTSYAPGAIIIEGEKIKAVGPPGAIRIPDEARVIDATDKFVVPGFIDTHVHGRDGHQFGEDTASTADLCTSIAGTGVTGLLPTLGAKPSMDDMLEGIRVVRQAMTNGTDGAEILGIHMEGPYMSKADIARGSQDVSLLREPSVKELHSMVDAADGTIRKMSISPELDGALDVIREMVAVGIVPSAAHSAATYEQAMTAVEAGLSCATHTFNGMIPLHHRKPGLLGAVLTCDEINAELIPDGQHVGEVAMQILLRCKGSQGVHLVTDNTIWAGMPNGTYQWSNNRTVVKEDQRVSVVGGTLAGSVASMNFGVGNLVRTVGCSLRDALQMATLNPAAVIGIEDCKGSLEVGKDGDLVIMDKDFEVCLSMVRGDVVYDTLESHISVGTSG